MLWVFHTSQLETVYSLGRFHFVFNAKTAASTPSVLCILPGPSHLQQHSIARKVVWICLINIIGSLTSLLYFQGSYRSTCYPLCPKDQTMQDDHAV